MEFGGVIAFAVVTESIFSWPGVGKMLIDAISVLDRPLIVAYLIFVVVMFVTLNLLIDILYSVLDPRVRVGGHAQ
jgi:peptide/nickel transport system permease protein